MFCPKCGRDCGDARFCRICGTQLRQITQLEQGAQQVFPKAPFTVKKSHTGHLEFGENSLHLVARLPKVPQKDLLISYQELFDVSYVPATKYFIGFLCVRKIADRHIPLPQTFWEKKLTDTMIWFSQRDNADFYRAYVFLKEIARINTRKR